MFENSEKNNRLSKNDAEYVEVIHTDTECYGIKHSIGTVDFYVNGGGNQPGCRLATCDHNRAVHYYAESLESTNVFEAKRCEGENKEDSVLMGGEPGNKDKGMSGEYCLGTNEKYPFGKGSKGLEDEESVFEELSSSTK